MCSCATGWQSVLYGEHNGHALCVSVYLWNNGRCPWMESLTLHFDWMLASNVVLIVLLCVRRLINQVHSAFSCPPPHPRCLLSQSQPGCCIPQPEIVAVTVGPWWLKAWEIKNCPRVNWKKNKALIVFFFFSPQSFSDAWHKSNSINFNLHCKWA